MNEKQKLQCLVEDFRRYSIILIAFSVLVYIGMMIKGFTSSNEKLMFLLAIEFVLITLAFLALQRYKNYKQRLMDMDENM